ncbi:MAG: protein translocase subunit SecF [Cyanobacteria bacterium]|nr:protein translocase subunit SecF [Cyanobacteria bacterium bin.51]
MALTGPFFRINRYRRLAWSVSSGLCLLSLLGLALSWLNPAIGAPLRPGLDFTGGTQIQLQRSCEAACSAIEPDQLAQALRELSLPAEDSVRSPNLDSAAIQLLDENRTVVLRLPVLSPAQTQALIDGLGGVLGPLQTSGTEVNTIGPSLGRQLLNASIASLLVSFTGIALYISFRYSRLYAFLALLCLAHDVLITTGLFAWLGLLGGLQVDSPFAVALLTVAGYSVNDTVVVFDRIRERQRDLAALSVEDQVDDAVAVTLTRSAYTSLTTLLPLLALIFFGGSTLFWFAIALSVGIGVGSWSSIAIAPTLLAVISGPAVPERSPG